MSMKRASTRQAKSSRRRDQRGEHLVLERDLAVGLDHVQHVPPQHVHARIDQARRRRRSAGSQRRTTRPESSTVTAPDRRRSLLWQSSQRHSRPIGTMGSLKRAEIDVAERIPVHREHVIVARADRRRCAMRRRFPARSARRNRRVPKHRICRPAPGAHIRPYVRRRARRARESEAQELVQQEGDEGSACDLGHRLRPVGHDAAQAGAQAAGEDRLLRASPVASSDSKACLRLRVR